MNRKEYLEYVGRKKCRCRYCGKEFKPKEASRTSYCSRDCYFAEKTKRKKERIRCKTEASLICCVCGNPFVGRRNRKYCSRECELKRARRYSFELNKGRKELTEHRCRGCGKAFISEYGNKKRAFCSIKCAHRYARRCSAGRKDRQRARRYGVAYEYINPKKVFDRDHWHCQICGKSTPEKNRGKFYSNAPELDHRIPMSKGGGHLYLNVQCACRKCNLMKSNYRSVGQIPLFEIKSKCYRGYLHSLEFSRD